ncbi:Crp/Fnr family transcriptional regulator [Mucilaginibacter boryungensis]|uniref:Crp/Fnr family transcriptional regulator n=1 Tax=Mucilaginibacter boryungensis TaxID=768480 RepID=A0ABR9XEJ4_9SPHI|nr:Crp/Fnr family transcriptional regulator [Mucilaginibacter boryungensis]MBE9665600.1 Crp/Fnr family transcriptional regulator [Mucilaginibacter boryungensis]
MDIKTQGCDLQSCFLCRLCLKDWLPAIAANKTTIKVKRGQQLFKEGDAATGIYFVNSGIVKVHKRWDADKELIIRFAKQGGMLGIMSLGENLTYPVSATVLESGAVCFISLEFFESTLKVNSDITYQLLLFFAAELRESEKRMRNLAHMPVKGRIAQALINLQKQFGLNQDGYIEIDLTRQDLASFAGATYETVFRMLNEMVKDGLLSTNGKYIKIVNTAGVMALVEEQE